MSTLIIGKPEGRKAMAGMDTRVIDWLKASGFIRDGEMVRRVVIDIAWDNAISVWVERMDTEPILKCNFPNVPYDRVVVSKERKDGTWEGPLQPVEPPPPPPAPANETTTNGPKP